MNSNDYEVFLSFRGSDTRQGFTDVLYNYMNMADIRTFRDDNELAVGDKIDSAIFRAIEGSKICIPIFSPNYANSKWCLREVTEMVKLEKTIVPVFYKVSPDDVKLKGASPYSDDLRMMEEQYHQEVNQWKNALQVAASHKGLELRDSPYTTFCKEIVDRVLLILGPRKRPSIDHFVGEDNKAAAMELLDMESSDQEVIYLVIHGMGGIGKTTITEFIYNELVSVFQHCSFVPNIRELFKSNAGGAEDLRSYLYRNLQPKLVEPSASLSEHFINGLNKKKVLIVLDDVDSYEQIERIVKDPSRFGSGTRIIVTTRDKNVVKAEDGRSHIIRYLEMKELKDDRALELFSRCAFRTLLPPSQYANLSKGFVAYAGGLPLAITVIAKYLRNTTQGVWKEVLERAKRNPLKEVKEKLLISYDALEEDDKMIFLDIACFFVDSVYTETSNMFYMWEACGLYPRLSLEVLQSRSLVRLGQKNELLMHDQLRDLGRDIARSKTGPTKQSRLWGKEQVLEVLNCKEKEKRENIEALRVPRYDGDNMFKLGNLSDFDKLRFLELRPKLHGKLSGKGIAKIKSTDFQVDFSTVGLP